ncbi:MAG: hypothetical protein E7549_01110 [Ruminococcaceae bacterium]|nr:hypothetical protein [Oscillospiraceae bacterium]
MSKVIRVPYTLLLDFVQSCEDTFDFRVVDTDDCQVTIAQRDDGVTVFDFTVVHRRDAKFVDGVV